MTRDEKIALSFEAKPESNSHCNDAVSLLGHWKWVANWNGHTQTDPSVGLSQMVDRGSWQPVAATEPFVTVKMLAWFTDTLMESDWTLLFYKTGGKTFPDDVANAYLKARSL